MITITTKKPAKMEPVVAGLTGMARELSADIRDTDGRVWRRGCKIQPLSHGAYGYTYTIITA